MRLLTSILLFALLNKAAYGGGCESIKITQDIDWDKLHGTWYDVIDIPRNATPYCWSYGNFRQVKGGVGFTSDRRELSDRENSEVIRQEFVYVRLSTGQYVDSGTYRNFTGKYGAALEDSSKQEKLEKSHEDKLHFEQTLFFLTDYDQYLILVLCDDPEWHAYVKSKTQNISMEFLEKIAKVLDEFGLKSPIMTLTTGCMRNKL